jgi:hypothetical protein
MKQAASKYARAEIHATTSELIGKASQTSAVHAATSCDARALLSTVKSKKPLSQ